MTKYVDEAEVMAEVKRYGEEEMPLIAAEYTAMVESFRAKHSQLKRWEDLTKSEAEELDRILFFESELSFYHWTRSNPIVAKAFEEHEKFKEWSLRLGYLPWVAP